MAHDPHHEHLIREMSEMLGPLFKNSPQAIYLYLDDEHKICNEKFAKMLGYTTPQEWVDNQYPLGDVVEEDQNKAVDAYMKASRKLTGSMLSGTWVSKKGKKIKTEVMMVPITCRDEVFVLHFISEKK